ncbi:hypothetical protein [Citricoccus sp. K5]|uniref:hypothetical protein n=1 Tax=Citricoccus sp. K5 TaxID=2653135 RepID=UPI0012F39B64|nr:hypothetical protein [Citricoccus sp. K5]VXB22513.1 hypothetical protein CITRIK5_20647 [Citricoccus sp. K5]
MPPRKTNTDTPFLYKSKTGAEIAVPSDVVFDPDADALMELHEAQSGSEMDQAAATLKLIKSGFPVEVSKEIKLKISEIEDFSRKYFAHVGVSLPKS